MTTDTRTVFDELILDAREASEVLTQQAAAQTEAMDEETKALLELAGLDHIPTIDEARELLRKRRAEIRQAVLVQADKRTWCEDGTRAVCANLRLERPGARPTRRIQLEATITLSLEYQMYTAEGVLAYLQDKGPLSEIWARSHLGSRSSTMTPVRLTIDDQVVELSALKNPESKEVSA